MLDLKPVDLEHRDTINDYLERFPPQISEHTFTNMYAWRAWRRVLFAEVDGTCCFVEDLEGQRHLFGPPAGDAPAPEVFAALSEAGISAAVRITENEADALRQEGLDVQDDRDNADYVYLVRDLAELSGRDFHRQKNLVNRCLDAYDCEYEAMTADNAGEAMEMQRRWCRERNCGKKESLCAELKAIETTLGEFAQLELMGCLVRIDGRAEAFCVGEALSPDTAVVHFEKAMTEYDGLYQVVNQWFCRNALDGFNYVNREQDMGISGLRRAKKSYNPDHMVDKFVALDRDALEGPLAQPSLDEVCQE